MMTCKQKLSKLKFKKQIKKILYPRTVGQFQKAEHACNWNIREKKNRET